MCNFIAQSEEIGSTIQPTVSALAITPWGDSTCVSSTKVNCRPWVRCSNTFNLKQKCAQFGSYYY